MNRDEQMMGRDFLLLLLLLLFLFCLTGIKELLFICLIYFLVQRLMSQVIFRKGFENKIKSGQSLNQDSMLRKFLVRAGSITNVRSCQKSQKQSAKNG